ncbi:MAG: hypothetical protein KH330_08560 [Clostridiales bacterium]|nr:hypothetical protein [Clostridiales bacterium]
MYEKTKLLELFNKAMNATDMVREDNLAVQADRSLSSYGKEKSQELNRMEYKEAMDGFREEMLAIVDAREADYIAFYKKTAMEYMKSYEHQAALMMNLDILIKGYMGKNEIESLIEAYSSEEMASSMIYDTLVKMKSPYEKLLDNRITVRKQQNAFESIRNIIKSKINVGLMDKPVNYIKSQDKAQAYFGSGYAAILEEVGEDLSLLLPEASLAMQRNDDKQNQIHAGTDYREIRQAAVQRKNQKSQEKKQRFIDRKKQEAAAGTVQE